MTDDINAGKGALGVMARDQEFAKKLQDDDEPALDSSRRLNNREGSVGKLLKDPALYDNTNELLKETRESDQGHARKSQEVSDHSSETVLGISWVHGCPISRVLREKWESLLTIPLDDSLRVFKHHKGEPSCSNALP